MMKSEIIESINMKAAISAKAKWREIIENGEEESGEMAKEK